MGTVNRNPKLRHQWPTKTYGQSQKREYQWPYEMVTYHRKKKHRVTIPCKWSFEKRRFSRKAALFTNGLPSVLYETPGLNERSVLNQLFLMISGAFHMKSAAFHEKCHISYEKRRISRKALLFIWKAPHFIWKAPHFTLSFWVMIKYRSFFRKTNKSKVGRSK